MSARSPEQIANECASLDAMCRGNLLPLLEETAQWGREQERNYESSRVKRDVIMHIANPFRRFSPETLRALIEQAPFDVRVSADARVGSELRTSTTILAAEDTRALARFTLDKAI